MEIWQWVVVGWLAFDVLVYIWAWADNYYFENDVRTKLRKFKEMITEE